jgi:hypothetical protein
VNNEPAPDGLPAELRRYTLQPEWMRAEADEWRRRAASEELARTMRRR